MLPIWILLGFICAIFIVLLIFRFTKRSSDSSDNTKSRKGVMSIEHDNSSRRIEKCVAHAEEVMERHGIKLD